MEVNTSLRGHLYPSRTTSRCPRFHACIITQKCQNYDPHRMDCSLCELRVRRKLLIPKDDVPLGGCLPEGQHQPDMQDAIKIIQEARGQALFHVDQEKTRMERTVDISNKLTRLRKATDMMALMNAAGMYRITEEDIKNGHVTPETLEGLGRIE